MRNYVYVRDLCPHRLGYFLGGVGKVYTGHDLDAFVGADLCLLEGEGPVVNMVRAKGVRVR